MSTNYFRKSKSLYSSTSNSFGTGTGVTITPSSVSGLPTDTQIVLTFDRVDTNGTAVPGNKIERILGTIVGANFVVTERGVDGTTEQAHTSPVVETIWNARDINDLMTGILAGHSQTGAHDPAVVTSMTAISIAGATWFLDEDDMATDSAVKVPSQQSVKAYADERARVPQTASTIDSATVTPDGSKGQYNVTAIAQAFTLAAPSGTPKQGQKLIIRIKDNGTARAITFNSIYRAVGTPLPTTTVVSKTLYLGFIYNATDIKWDLVASAQEA